MSLLGSPHNADLLDQERDLFLKVGINPPCEVMLYPSLQLAANKRIVVAQSRSRSIKRNNCCLAFLSGYGLLTKIIVYKEPTGGTKCYLLVMKMNPAPMKICTDEITNAQFHKHFIAFYPPR